MLHANIGDVVRMRDGRIVEVTDAPEDNLPLETISHYDYIQHGRETVTSSMPAETIFGGNEIYKGRKAGRVYSDMSEVVSILD